MGRSMAHIAHQPGPVWLESGVGLAGRGGEFGGGAAPAPTGGAWGASSIRVAKKNARFPGPRALRAKQGPAGMAKLRPLIPGGPGETKPLLFTTPKPCQMCKKKAVVVHVTRW
jgi:hypothetical protein